MAEPALKFDAWVEGAEQDGGKEKEAMRVAREEPLIYSLVYQKVTPSEGSTLMLL